MIRQLALGVYSYLPLGRRVLLNVERIVREEMDRAGCQEVFAPYYAARRIVGGVWQIHTVRPGAHASEGPAFKGVCTWTNP